MSRTACDVLVIGAGPAGSSAARIAAENGADVIMVERKALIGLPVRCAEYIPAQLPGEINLGREYIVWPVKGMRTVLPDGSLHELKSPGFTINRDVLDQTLARAAEHAGARIIMSASATALVGGEVSVRHEKIEKISARIIIGADGPRSRVGRWIGAVNTDLIPSVQARMRLKMPLDFTEIYFDKEFFGGYGWLFPKGSEANVGIGRKAGPQITVSLNRLLEHFIDRLVHTGKIHPETLNRFAGWVPAAPVSNPVKDHILLVGDAAGQTHPITGAGIAPAVICGKIAGLRAAQAAKANDISLLNEYAAECRDLFGDVQQRAVCRRILLEKEWNRLDEVIKKCWVSFREYYAGD
jgi:digeranylgeranylglycerophospholipid reductase